MRRIGGLLLSYACRQLNVQGVEVLLRYDSRHPFPKVNGSMDNLVATDCRANSIGVLRALYQHMPPSEWQATFRNNRQILYLPADPGNHGLPPRPQYAATRSY